MPYTLIQQPFIAHNAQEWFVTIEGLDDYHTSHLKVVRFEDKEHWIFTLVDRGNEKEYFRKTFQTEAEVKEWMDRVLVSQDAFLIDHIKSLDYGYIEQKGVMLGGYDTKYEVKRDKGAWVWGVYNVGTGERLGHISNDRKGNYRIYLYSKRKSSIGDNHLFAWSCNSLKKAEKLVKKLLKQASIEDVVDILYIQANNRLLGDMQESFW